MKKKIGHCNKLHLQTEEYLYAGAVSAENGAACFIYIGGKYYGDVAQIHLTKSEAKMLHKWLSKHFKKEPKR